MPMDLHVKGNYPSAGFACESEFQLFLIRLKDELKGIGLSLKN